MSFDAELRDAVMKKTGDSAGAMRLASVRRMLFDSRWGSKSFVMLCLSLFSGIVVALQYDSANPYFASASLDLIIPFGAFWRSVHFYSSQLFFFFSVLHFTVIALEHRIERMPFFRWFNLCLSLPVALLLLFTGYILRGDATGEAAGYIAENISLSVPALGSLVNSLLFSLSSSGIKRVFANHLAGLVFFWIVLSWEHVRRFKLEWDKSAVELIALLLFCVFVTAPLETHGAGASLIGGPWFFLGLQELLRVVQPFWAGVLFPASLIVALFFLYPPRYRKASGFYILFWCLAYAALTALAYWRLLS